MSLEFRNLVLSAAQRSILFLPHALEQMASPERRITRAEVKDVVYSGEMIENYPNDPRGHSCLLSGLTSSGRPIHVVCAPKEDYLVVITAYPPDPERWSEDFSMRKK